MKKFLSTLLIYCGFGVLFIGCFNEKYLITSSEMQLEGVEIDSISGLPLITGPFNIVDNHFVRVAANEMASLGLNQANAFSPGPMNILNRIVLEETQLYFDQAIKLGSIIIPASTDLLGIPDVRDGITLEHYVDDFSALYIRFDSIFFDPPVFTDGPMNIKLLTETEDETFESTLDVIVNMQ